MVTQHVCAIVALFLGQAAAECNIAGMSQTCAKHPPQKMDDKDPQKICKSGCTHPLLCPMFHLLLFVCTQELGCKQTLFLFAPKAVSPTPRHAQACA